MSQKTASEIDIFVGRRICWRRRELAISREDLARRLGLTFQQVHKYETGRNRLSAGRLHEVAAVLQAPVTYFFPEEELEALDLWARLDPCKLDVASFELIAAYVSIGDPQVRRSILAVVQGAASDSEAASGKPAVGEDCNPCDQAP